MTALKSHTKPQTCKYCTSAATKSVLHAEGMAYVPCCDGHLDKAKADAIKATPDGTPDPSNINGIYEVGTGKKLDLSAQAKGTGAAQPRRGTLGAVNPLDLAERAMQIEDPVRRKKVMGQILDLALTKDGRKSFKNQGKWKHGFVPMDEPAVTAKAKGSPIARQRIKRVFGGQQRRIAATDPNQRPQERLKVEAGKGKTVASASAGALRGVKAPDIQRTQRVKNSQLESNKVGRVKARATRAWDDIPDNAKTVRNGKRYVVSEYQGNQVLTEWQGNIRETEAKDTTQQVTLTEGDAANMSTAELRRILKDPKAGKSAKQVAYRTLQAKLAAGVKPE